MSSRRTPGSGSIRLRSNGEYEGRYTTGRHPVTGKQMQKSITGKTKRDVEQKLRKICTEIQDGTYMEPSRLTVQEWAAMWLDMYTSNIKPGTRVLYERQVRLYIVPHLGRKKMAKLTTHDIQGMYAKLMAGNDGTTLTAKSIKNLHGVLHKMLEKAFKTGGIRANPSNACELPSIRGKEIKAFTRDEIRSFLGAIKGHRFEAVYSVALFTGLRQSELLGLTWDCIDFDNGTIRVYRQLQLLNGTYAFGTLKNDKPRTIVPASSVMQTLRDVKRKQGTWKLAAGGAWNDEWYVFTDEIGHHLARQTVYCQYKKIVRNLGMPASRFHDLRHSYAVASLQAGDNIKAIQSNLGHHAASFTLDVYGHTTDDMKRDSAVKMEEFIKQVS